MNGDQIAVEILTWIISAFITWIIGIFKIKEIKEYEENFKMMFKYNLIIVMSAMILVDTIFFGALEKGIMQFVFLILLSTFFMAIWSAIISGIGVIIVPIIKNIILRIKQIKKEKIISNSKLYKKIIDNISCDLTNIIDIKINSKGMLINRNGNSGFSIIFAVEGFSDLDNIGIYGLGNLINKKYSIFNFEKFDDGVILNNKKYNSQIKNKEKEKLKNKAIQEKHEIKKAKELKKQKIENGEDW